MIQAFESALAMDGRYDALACDSEFWKMRADGVGNVGWGEVGVVFLCHPRVGMAELRGDNAHRYATHCKCRSMRVAEDVKGDGR